MDKNKNILEIDDFKEKAKNRKDDLDDVLIRKKLNIGTKVLDDDKRIIEFIASTDTRDRDGDTINPLGWDLSNFNKNPVFLWSHQYDRPSLGKVIDTEKTNSALKQTVQFMGADVIENQEYKDWPEWLKFADLVYKMYKNSYLNAVSVGFDPVSWKWSDEAEGNIDFKEQEQLELSAVPVPANPESLQAAGYKGKKLIANYFNKAEEILNLDDKEEILVLDEEKEIEIKNIEYVDNEIEIEGVKLTEEELNDMIDKAIKRQIKWKTGKVL